MIEVNSLSNYGTLDAVLDLVWKRRHNLGVTIVVPLVCVLIEKGSASECIKSGLRFYIKE